jgi:hypothetical protein
VREDANHPTSATCKDEKSRGDSSDMYGQHALIVSLRAPQVHFLDHAFGPASESLTGLWCARTRNREDVLRKSKDEKPRADVVQDVVSHGQCMWASKKCTNSCVVRTSWPGNKSGLDGSERTLVEWFQRPRGLTRHGYAQSTKLMLEVGRVRPGPEPPRYGRP